MEILKVTKADAKALLEVYAPYVKYTSISFEYEVPSEEEFGERIKNISSGYPYIKAVDEEGRILGYAYANTFKPRAAYDWSAETTIYVRGDVRGQGVGRKLYEVLEASLKNMGIQNLNSCIAYTEIEDEHLTNASMRFHMHLGYTQVARFHKCAKKFDKWYDMIWMEKHIGEHLPDQKAVTFGKWEI